jgi:hypothetical protein
MTALAELQRQFHAALMAGEDCEIEVQIREDGLAPSRRLQIYRNTARLLLIEALKANFPATSRIVDEQFFAYAASEFIRLHPPRQPRLAEYGAELPAFLAGFAPTATLPWLPDLARLEWAMLQCQEAEQAPALTTADLERTPAESFPHIRFVRHPACRLLASPWQVDRIRSFALAGGEGFPPGLEGDAVRLLVRRSEEGVVLRRLPEAGFALLDRLLAGVSVAEALDGSEPDCASILAAALRDGLFAKS